MVDISAYKKKHVQIDGLESFRSAAEAFGLSIRDIVTTGQFQRVPDNAAGKKNRDGGWYILQEADGIYFGAMGSWYRREQQTYCNRQVHEMTAEQRIAIHAAQQQALKESEARHAAAAEKAEKVIDLAPPADPNHEYLVAKRIKPNGALQRGLDIIIPAMDLKGKVHSYETIGFDKEKRFLKDGAKRGFFFPMGAISSPIYIAEGFATGATVHEITGSHTVIAFDRTNLGPVATVYREAFPEHEIIILADNDQWTEGNPGLTDAKEVEKWIKGVKVVYPTFKNLSTKPTDFNDLFILEGIDAVRLQLGLNKLPVVASALGLINPSKLPQRQFLYGSHLIRKYCSATISPGGMGKTQLVMTDAIAMVTGLKLLHDQPHELVRAWHYNLEDPLDELQRRAIAICQAHNIPLQDVAKDLFLNSGRERNLIVLEKSKTGEYARPDADGLYKAIIENGISALSIDPFVKIHHADENSNKDIDEVLTIFGQIANDTNCAIDLVHHTKKGAAGVSQAGNIDSARGASSLAGAVRSARTLTGMSNDEAEEFGLQVDQRGWYLRIDDAKANMAPPSAKTHWLERKSIMLPNGDNVGAVSTWEPPKAFENIQQGDIDLVLRLLSEDFYTPAELPDLIAKKSALNIVQADKLAKTWLKSGRVFKQKEMCEESKKHKMRVLPSKKLSK